MMGPVEIDPVQTMKVVIKVIISYNHSYHEDRSQTVNIDEVPL